MRGKIQKVISKTHTYLTDEWLFNSKCNMSSTRKS